MITIIKNGKTAHATEIVRAYDHHVRKQILQTIDTAGEIRVTDLYKTLGLEQAQTSIHLRILRNAGLVNVTRRGKERIYQINYLNIEKANTAVNALSEIKMGL